MGSSYYPVLMTSYSFGEFPSKMMFDKINFTSLLGYYHILQ